MFSEHCNHYLNDNHLQKRALSSLVQSGITHNVDQTWVTGTGPGPMDHRGRGSDLNSVQVSGPRVLMDLWRSPMLFELNMKFLYLTDEIVGAENSLWQHSLHQDKGNLFGCLQAGKHKERMQKSNWVWCECPKAFMKLHIEHQNKGTPLNIQNRQLPATAEPKTWPDWCVDRCIFHLLPVPARRWKRWHSIENLNLLGPCRFWSTLNK